MEKIGLDCISVAFIMLLVVSALLIGAILYDSGSRPYETEHIARCDTRFPYWEVREWGKLHFIYDDFALRMTDKEIAEYCGE